MEGHQCADDLAVACLDTRVITVCDREADLWELVRKATTTHAGLLVRACRGRRRRVVTTVGPLECLWDHVAGQPSLARKTIIIEACGRPRSRKERRS